MSKKKIFTLEIYEKEEKYSFSATSELQVSEILGLLEVYKHYLLKQNEGVKND